MRVAHQLRLSAPGDPEWAGRPAGGPADLGDPDRGVVAGLANQSAGGCHRLDGGAGVRRVRVEGQRVEGAARARSEHAADELSEWDPEAALGQSCAHDLRPGVDRADAAPRGLEKGDVLGRIRPAGPVHGNAWLVPDLPGANRQLGEVGALGPQAPVGAVAARQHGSKAAQVPWPTWGVRPAPGSSGGGARAEGRRVEEDGKDPNPLPRQRGHVAVVEPQVIAAGGLLDP